MASAQDPEADTTAVVVVLPLPLSFAIQLLTNSITPSPPAVTAPTVHHWTPMSALEDMIGKRSDWVKTLIRL